MVSEDRNDGDPGPRADALPGPDDGDRYLEWDEATVPLGPFNRDPFDLGFLQHGLDGRKRTGEQIVAASYTWLTGALCSACVDLGAHDAEVARLIASDGWPIVQVVAGWVARAHPTETSTGVRPAYPHHCHSH